MKKTNLSRWKMRFTIVLFLCIQSILGQTSMVRDTRLSSLTSISDATSAVGYGDNAILITTKGGDLYRYRILQKDTRRIYSESVSTTGEHGLLSTITRGNTIWMYSVDRSRKSVIRRGMVTENTITNVRTIWSGNRTPECSTHVGGRLVIDNNGHLFISIGDICNPSFSQDPDEYYGKVLRMDVNGNPVSSNPWFLRGGNARYVYAVGLRNPFRMYYSSKQSRLYVLDVGQNRLESIYNIRRGDNYGWPSNGI